MSSTITLSALRLQQNVATIQSILGDTALLAVIKADGYGHSATLVAPILARAGVPWLGVTDAEEGAAVRLALQSAGFPHGPEILIMTAPPGDAVEAAAAAALTLRHALTPIVSASSQLAALAANPGQPIHLEVDTGMSRQGIQPGPALQSFLSTLSQHRSLRLTGLCTHFASAECTDATQTLAQMALFHQACAQIKRENLYPDHLHIGNTSTLDNASPAAAPILARLTAMAAKTSATPMARAGIGLYGLSLPLDPDTPAEARLHPNLRPILTWTTTITAIEDVPAGAKIGYGATYTAPSPMRLALLPVGYADGLRRGLSSTNAQPGGWVLIHNQRCPILGRISMNLTTVDVTHLTPAPTPGTPVILLGDGISALDHAALAQCLPYEILCGLRANHYAVS